MAEANTRAREMIPKEGEKTDPKSLPDPTLTRLQQQALRRLNQVLEAVKEQANANQGGGGQQAGGGPGGGGEGGEGGEQGGGGGQGDSGLPPLAQLKLLKALQVEVKDASTDFMKKHPELNKLTDAEKKEYKSLNKQQGDIAKLLEDLRRPADERDDMEGEKK